MAAVASVPMVVERWRPEGWMIQVYGCSVTPDFISQLDLAWDLLNDSARCAVLGKISFGRLMFATRLSLTILPLSVIAEVLSLHEARQLIGEMNG